MLRDVIRSWADAETERLFTRERSKYLPPDIQATALRKLKMLNAAIKIDDLFIPPSNRLEKLKRGSSGSVEHRDQHAVANLLPVGSWSRVRG